MKNEKIHYHKTPLGLTSIPIYNIIFNKFHYHNTPSGPTTINRSKNGYIHKLKIRNDKWIDLL